MRVVATSDLHGHLDRLRIEPCDLLVIAGDAGPAGWGMSRATQRRWFDNDFPDWIASEACPAERVVWIAGNHDEVIEVGGPGDRLSACSDYLQDSALALTTEEHGELVLWGTPWVSGDLPREMAFVVDESVRERAFAKIPLEADIVIAHSPPAGYGDFSINSGVHIGSPALWSRLFEVKPRLVVFGHCHEGYGRWTAPWGGELINASHCNGCLEPANPPVVVDL